MAARDATRLHQYKLHMFPVMLPYTNCACAILIPVRVLLVLHGVYYRVAGNFRRKKFSEISEKTMISENIFPSILCSYI